MKKLILILSTILASSSFFSQKNEIVLQYGSHYSDNYVKASDNDSKTFADNSRESYLYSLGGLAGIKYRRQFKGVKIGVGFNYVAFAQELENITFGDEIDPQTGSRKIERIAGNFIIANNFIDIPLTVSYTLGSKKLKGFVEGGLSNFFYVNTGGSLETRKIDSYKAYNLGINLALGGRYDFNDKLMLELNTHYQQFITGLIKNKPDVQERPFGIGLTVGLGYKF